VHGPVHRSVRRRHAADGGLYDRLRVRDRLSSAAVVMTEARFTQLAIGCAALLAACGEPQTSQSAKSQAPDPLGLTSGFEPTRCLPGGDVHLSPGTVIRSVMHMADGTSIKSEETITAVSPSMVTGRTVSNGIDPGPISEFTAAGFFPLGYDYPSQRLRRLYEYRPEPKAAVSSLALGGEQRFAVAEANVDGDRSHVANHEFTVTLVACGNLVADKESSPVRVYRSVIYNQYSQGEPPAFQTRKSEFLSYVSVGSGWPLRRQWNDGSYQEVTEIVAPH
jgi:hypothetical protein